MCVQETWKTTLQLQQNSIFFSHFSFIYCVKLFFFVGYSSVSFVESNRNTKMIINKNVKSKQNKTKNSKWTIKSNQTKPKTNPTYYFTDPAPSERGRTISRISVAKGSNLNFRGRKSNSLMNLCGKDCVPQTIKTN